jgi:Tol biopolymer transport system component
LELKGSAATIAQDVETISASRTGTLVYNPRNAAQNEIEWRWLDRSGKQIPDAVGTREGADASISRSGKRWAISVNGDLWLHELAGGAPSRFTFEPTDDRFFTWSPDDQWIAYATGAGRAHDRILQKNTVTSTATETLVSGGFDLHADDWSRDGRFLLFSETGKSTGWDLWTLDVQTKGAKPVPYLQTPAGERVGAFSPDGRWIAYQSDESGQEEVYVQSFPLGGGKFQVSTSGGGRARWRADGRELYFTSGESLMAVKINTSPRFEASTPQALFSIPQSNARTFDVAADGNRFLVRTVASEGGETPSSTVIVNWQAGLKR